MKGISDTFLTDKVLPVLDDWPLDMITAYSGSDRKEGLISPDGYRYLIKYAEAHTRVRIILFSSFQIRRKNAII